MAGAVKSISIRSPWKAAAAAAVALTLGVIGSGASGAGAQNEDAEQRRARVLDYWTPARVESARPLLPVLEATPTARPANPGGGGGGGSDGGSVLGEPWNGSSGYGMVGETTGKVLLTMNGSDYVCSGSTVGRMNDGPSLVLTAAHCLHNGDNKSTSWATNWIFIPAYEDGGSFTSCDATTSGCWIAADLVTPTTWYTNGDFRDDAGFAVMDLGGKSGESNRLADVVGFQSIKFTERIVGIDTYAFGYPAAKKYNGSDLIYCAGVAVAGVQDGTAGLGCKMTGGSSGGPWYVPFSTGNEVGTAVSVNSHVYRSVKDVMFGPVFDGDESAAYTEAHSDNSAGARSRSES